MGHCDTCGKEFKFIPSYAPIIGKAAGKKFCSKKCWDNYDPQQGSGNKQPSQEEKVKEWQCKCNQCGKLWHYLDSRKKQLQQQANSNALFTCATCCSPFAMLTANKAADVRRQADDLDKCPDCGSCDVTKKEIVYDKPK